jgi:hypothetical protein
MAGVRMSVSREAVSSNEKFWNLAYCTGMSPFYSEFSFWHVPDYKGRVHQNEIRQKLPQPPEHVGGSGHFRRWYRTSVRTEPGSISHISRVERADSGNEM